METAKIILIIVCLNTLLYIGGAKLTNDITDRFVTVSGDNVVGAGDFQETVPTSAEGSVGDISTDLTGLSSFDALGLVIDSLLFLVNIVLAPVALLVNTGMPFFLQLMLGVPIMIMYVFGIIVLMRGGGA